MVQVVSIIAKNAMTTVGQTITGDVAIRKADIDNLRLDGNVILQRRY